MQEFGKHLWDIIKAALAVALVNAVVSFLSYLGAHIPPLAELAASVGSGVAAIKIRLS